MKKYYVTVANHGSIFWYKDAKRTILHREDGPAYTTISDDKFWYIDGKLHRVDGPAVIHNNGSEYWYVNGLQHKEDGPAVVYKNGYKEWWLHNVRMSEQEFLERTRPVEELTVAQIEQLLGKRVKIIK